MYHPAFQRFTDELLDSRNGSTAYLVAAAKTKSLDKLKAAFKPVAATCKACHEQFHTEAGVRPPRAAFR